MGNDQRFLREGDRLEIPVVLHSAAPRELRGVVTLRLFDPESGASRLQELGVDAAGARRSFHLPPGGAARVAFPLVVPHGTGLVAFEVLAEAGDLRDGERRPLPLLPARVAQIESRIALFRDAGRRELDFAGEAAIPDPTRRDERLVVTVEGQLFDGLLAALPYLADDPYECSEQTLNRFLSTALLTDQLERSPALAELAADLARRTTQNQPWEADDPNRAIALEETPFLAASRGDGGKDLPRILDPAIAHAQRDVALARLGTMQLPSGAFPWWPKGEASDYLTIYVLYGYGKAVALSGEASGVSKDQVRKAWSYLAERSRSGELPGSGARRGTDLLTFLVYAATLYPDRSWFGTSFPEAEQEAILEAAFAARREASLYVKSLLALALHRRGRTEDAGRVLDSILDRATSTPEGGISFPPQGRGWWWWNDPIETQAAILLALQEIRPADPRRHGLVQWLYLHRELNHWRSTRATAEVLYAVGRYLGAEGEGDRPRTVTVTLGERTSAFALQPASATRIVVPGPELAGPPPKIVVDKPETGFLYVSAVLHSSSERPRASDDRGLLAIARQYLKVEHGPAGETLRPLDGKTTLRPGDEVEVRLTVRASEPVEYLHLRDPRPAGLEPGLALSGWRWEQQIPYYQETRDSATSLFFERLSAGTRTFSYRLRASLAGEFRVAPATLQSMYAPELAASTAGGEIEIAPGR